MSRSDTQGINVERLVPTCFYELQPVDLLHLILQVVMSRKILKDKRKKIGFDE